ncbi:D-tyrosyl-tRNA(Tyr) deacylase [Metallosphaera tengchongensis]|uniref:D-tyrosyl-tRNA(Tyr) deacylase n=1 Tax=Metallosphaera tengchongensis TaxID=1532350 RepID=A0A6N0NUD9_9CREN|nr:D-aminoacyl-tRNA deacylase [Metallosphaera tengchongensis]QKR00416.1 D-tyrosyl-tRNA(Tyr) deacylase [Metallosphaera tengchongensis]
MKVSVIISSQDPVGKTLKRLGYQFEEITEDVVDFSYNKGDAVIMICRHESSSRTPTITVHHPGNPGGKPLGGKPWELGIANPRLLTSIFREILKMDTDLDKVIEATHHGPTNLPVSVTFVEIGSDERFWTNQGLVDSLARAVLRGIENFENTDCSSTYLVFGGPHYSRTASSLAKMNCISHIISKHFISELNSNLIFQAIERNVTKPNTAILDSIQREKREMITNILSSNNISFQFR